MNKVLPYAKAIIAVLGAVVTTALVQFPDNLALRQWGPVVASLVTALSVYLVPNNDPLGQKQSESVQPPPAEGILGKAREDGYGAVDLLLFVFIAIVIVWLLTWLF